VEARVHFGFTGSSMVHNLAAGIIGGIIKGMKGKAKENAKMRESLTPNSQRTLGVNFLERTIC
jgi:syntaxin-binding protein 5